MSIYDDCNRRLDEAETNQPPLDEAEWQPNVKDEEIRIADIRVNLEDDQ
jgi:hypothetical protein